MLQDIHDISKLGFKMHLVKTKVMCNKHVNKDDVIVDGKKIEEVDRYVYHGQMVTIDHNQVQELKRRIGQGWSAFCKLDNIIQDNDRMKEELNFAFTIYYTDERPRPTTTPKRIEFRNSVSYVSGQINLHNNYLAQTIFFTAYIFVSGACVC